MLWLLPPYAEVSFRYRRRGYGGSEQEIRLAEAVIRNTEDRSVRSGGQLPQHLGD